MKIGNVELKSNIFLAPMAGVTDMPYRLLCKEKGCGLLVTEMVSAKSILYNNKGTSQLLEINEKEHPIAIQLFGSEPLVIANAVDKINHMNFEIVDINMGCPVPKVFNNNEGSALMQDPLLIGRIIKEITKATEKPVTIKIRLGINDSCINAVEVAKIAEANGVSAIAVHGRTREQYYSGVANWSVIKDVKNAVKVPIIGNGDVFDGLSAKKIIDETNCDGIMVARGAQGNPWIFSEIIQYLETGIIADKPTLSDKISVIKRHLTMLVDFKGEYIGVREMRKHIGWYIKGMYGATDIRVAFNKAESIDEMIELLVKLESMQNR